MAASAKDLPVQACLVIINLHQAAPGDLLLTVIEVEKQRHQRNCHKNLISALNGHRIVIRPLSVTDRSLFQIEQQGLSAAGEDRQILGRADIVDPQFLAHRSCKNTGRDIQISPAPERHGGIRQGQHLAVDGNESIPLPPPVPATGHLAHQHQRTQQRRSSSLHHRRLLPRRFLECIILSRICHLCKASGT